MTCISRRKGDKEVNNNRLERSKLLKYVVILHDLHLNEYNMKAYTSNGL